MLGFDQKLTKTETDLAMAPAVGIALTILILMAFSGAPTISLIKDRT